MNTRVIFLLFVAAAGYVEGLNSTENVTESSSTEPDLKSAVIFYLYTKSQLETGEIIYLNDDDTLSASSFNTSVPTRILIHGWRSYVGTEFETIVREAYLGEGDYNVIEVDWSEYADYGYIYAGTHIDTIGEYVGQMIDYLEGKGMSLADLIVIGHSLGAHVAGIACRTATNIVGSLIGLDPAGPLYFSLIVGTTLKSTDAAFVQVIHTSAGRLGTLENLGHVDFWVNGGYAQPGCGMDLTGSCSHGRSYEYLAESISSNPSKFIARNCDIYYMYLIGACSSRNSSYLGGLTLDTSATGNYYLNTNADAPYAQG